LTRAPAAAMLHIPLYAHLQREAAMKKVQLKLDTLRVDSFPTAERIEERGTVKGQQLGSWGANCTNTTCPPYHCFCTEMDSCRCQ
jgi:hypothetical protein